MPYLAVCYDVQALVEPDLIACACPAVYYLLGYRAKAGPSLRSLDGIVTTLTVDAVHSPLCIAAVDEVGLATSMDVVGACVGEGVGVFIVRTAPEVRVGSCVPVDVVRAIVSLQEVATAVTVHGVCPTLAKH